MSLNGIEEKDIPSGYVRVPFILDNNGVEHKLDLIGGFLGTQQRNYESISPYVGWIVAESEQDE